MIEQPPATHIGTRLQKGDWEIAIRNLKEVSNGTSAALYLPKVNATYAGKMLLASDTHLVQRVGESTGIIHDFSKLENGAAIKADIRSGKLREGQHMRLAYGLDQGKAEVVTFTALQQERIGAHVAKWAAAMLPNDKTRATFLKHVDASLKDYATGQPQQAKSPTTGGKGLPEISKTPVRGAPDRSH